MLEVGTLFFELGLIDIVNWIRKILIYTMRTLLNPEIIRRISNREFHLPAHINLHPLTGLLKGLIVKLTEKLYLRSFTLLLI